MNAAKTNAERQREFRARKAEAPEVRGIFAHPDDHAEVKEAAAEIERLRAALAAEPAQPDECLRLADAIDPMTRKGLDNLTCAVAAKLLRSFAVPPQPEPVADEVKRLRDEYQGSCELVAKMHAAAVGYIGGPEVGPVEDIANLRAEVERLRAIERAHGIGEKP